MLTKINSVTILLLFVGSTAFAAEQPTAESIKVTEQQQESVSESDTHDSETLLHMQRFEALVDIKVTTMVSLNIQTVKPNKNEKPTYTK